MTAVEIQPQLADIADYGPTCPFCHDLLVESEDGDTLVCETCRTDVLVDGCPS